MARPYPRPDLDRLNWSVRASVTQHLPGVLARGIHGVDLRCGVEVTAIRPTNDGSASAGAVRLGDDTEVAADVVIVGIGISPAVALA